MKSERYEEPVTTVKITGVSIIMSYEEARALRTVVGNIGGPGPLREVTDALYDALGEAGIEGYATRRVGNDCWAANQQAFLNGTFTLEEEED